MALLVLCYVIVLGFVTALAFNTYRHKRARDTIRYRIHINGARGKQRSTYYISAILRSAGLTTYGKTVGSNGRIILPDGTEAITERYIDTTAINEQIDALRSFAKQKAEAVVMECVTAQPKDQDWLEHHIMRSQIVVITHVQADPRRKNQDQSLASAHRLAEWIPHKAYVVTAERQPELLAVLEEACKRKQSKLIAVQGSMIKLATLKTFNLMMYLDEVAIGLAVARLVGVPDAQALQAMANAYQNPEVRRLEQVTVDAKDVVWANLFGIDDDKSVEQMTAILTKQFPDYYRVVVVNGRTNHLNTITRFSKLAQDGLHAQTVVAFGDHEERVEAAVRRKGVKVLALGNASMYGHVSGDVLLDQILRLTNHSKILLIGIAGNRTNQSDQVVRFINRLAYQKLATKPATREKEPARA